MEGSGEAGAYDYDDEEDDEYLDLDDDENFKETTQLGGAIDDKNEAIESTPLMPTRVIPTLLSPSFEIGGGRDGIEPTKAIAANTAGINIQPSKSLVVPSQVVRSSIVHYDVSIASQATTTYSICVVILLDHLKYNIFVQTL